MRSEFTGRTNRLLVVTVPTLLAQGNLPALQRVVLSLLINLPRHFDQFHVDIITEGNVDHLPLIQWIDSMGRLADPIRIVNVPAEYATPNGSRFKTRANHFAMEARRAGGENTEYCYVYHLDDDTHIGEDTAASLAEFIELDGDHFYLAQGILAFPHELTTSKFCRLADSIRPADDLSRFAFFTGAMGTPLGGLHGEHLVVRADIEDEIGWDFPNTVIEDAYFAIQFSMRYPRRSTMLNFVLVRGVTCHRQRSVAPTAPMDRRSASTGVQSRASPRPKAPLALLHLHLVFGPAAVRRSGATHLVRLGDRQHLSDQPLVPSLVEHQPRRGLLVLYRRPEGESVRVGPSETPPPALHPHRSGYLPDHHCRDAGRDVGYRPVHGIRETKGVRSDHQTDLRHPTLERQVIWSSDNPGGSLPRPGGTRGLRSGLVAVVVVVAVAVAIVTSGCTTSLPPVTGAGPATIVGPIALGVNIAAWDDIYSETGTYAVTKLLRTAGLRLLRYPGGSWADEYDWANDTDTSACNGAATSCAAYDPLTFDAISKNAKAAGASTFITVNYGSGTPAEAAAWVAYVRARSTSHDVALWEVGNESYSCYEVNDHLADSPTFVSGYVPDGTVCPPTSAMAKSYAVNALPYLEAMKRVGPTGRIGVPWAFSGTEAKGAGVSDAPIWDSTVLGALGKDIGFVDAHWYPFDTTAGITDQQILSSIQRIPSAASRIRTALHRDAPAATFVVGETNISERLTPLDFEPVTALFAAATSLEWLVQGAASVDWWDLNNYGTLATGDFGIVTSGGQETRPEGTPLPPYYGEELASRLTSAGSALGSLATGRSSVIGFDSTSGNKRRILLMNTDPDVSSSISASWFGGDARLQVETYSASTATTSDPITRTTQASDHPVSLPALSIVVLSGPATPG